MPLDCFLMRRVLFSNLLLFMSFDCFLMRRVQFSSLKYWIRSKIKDDCSYFSVKCYILSITICIRIQTFWKCWSPIPKKNFS
jgi:hypothetical protein